ncbi:hypothetical protein POV27_18425 [Aureisphaera galaxeae]|uniref:hypothetical protein n=1 Tax=Aureisphaera galaxeae TaxID=1538023 RepID=UPI002350B556|nr:hypothetical protein [Aureisphaera galaxeae]MDC8006034.1 hypothetical protein [Aureisphaera galaxeae]
MAKEPIVSTLFRFVTTRNPKLLSKTERERGFVYYPSNEKSNSHFLIDLEDEKDPDTRRTMLEGRTATYNGLSKRSTVEAVKPDLYEFSHWLMENKNTLTIDQVGSRLAAPTLPTLTTSQLITLWDNLHYQILTKKSAAVREAIIRMIVADNFLKKDDSRTALAEKLINSDEELQRLAHAYVVIEDGVLNNHASRNNAPIGQTTTQKQFGTLNKQLESFEAKQKLDTLREVKKELKGRVEVNEQENRDAYAQAVTTYDSALKTAYDNATKSVDSQTGEITYTNLVLPTLNYTPASIFDSNNLQGKVGDTTLNIFNKIVAEGVNNEELLFKKLNEEVQRQSELYRKGTKKSTRSILFNGSMIKVGAPAIPVNSYSASAIQNPKNLDMVMVSINLVTGNSDLRITETDLSIVFESEVSANKLDVLQVDAAPGAMILSNNEQEITIPSGAKSLTLTGTITLDGDEILEVDTELIIGGQKSNGEMTNQKHAQESKKVEHHGIKKIGVADFRRVEQEVCCYVPGEVSHIENILAKEYKERSTRRLLSTENTTEVTEENEVENLTDTTTSERNELATEVSSIVNEDKAYSYGASAGVSGSFGAGPAKTQFSADAYYNGASSSSSSNSNNTYQNYAEEVTQRALERVVQKVTKKRTSRIIREFEDSNKHGFDNREGISHVTGVYRWVDKIYTNRLVNYGKRLMYEFNVPEPSRYFKHAIIETIEGENPEQISGIPGGLLAPPEPPPIDFDATDIQPEDYHVKAALYKAVVTAPPVEEMYIGHSFAYTAAEIGGDFPGLNERNAEKVDLEIPEGYEAYKASANWRDSEDGGNEYSDTVVLVGGRKMMDRGELVDILPHVEKIPASFSQVGHIAGNSSVSVKLRLLPEAMEKWRNETYDAIVAAYQDRVNEYNDWLYANFEPTLPEVENTTKKHEFNPLLNRALEKRELKRLAIDMLARPFGISTARNHYLTKLTHPHLTLSLERHAEYVKFFEQAFDWEIMAYIFYPYFYSNRWRWDSLILESNGIDPIFQAFLQSGMARMVVPVRPGFEKAVAYFMETGDVMMGDQLAVEREDDLYLSIAEEMEQTEGKVEKEWETRVPTALTIVQSDSGPLTENGLPCCHNDDATQNLAYGSSIMVGGTTSGV